MKMSFPKTTLKRVAASLRSSAVVPAPVDGAATSRSSTARRIAVGVAMSAAAHAAYAGGGLNAGTQAVSTFTTWFYSLAGIGAGAYLVWQGVQCWSNKADWIHDFGGGIAKVAGVGSALVLAGWAFGLFG
ncbi:hypothetical protein C5615_32855 [Burkholderia cepacia]|uniref:Conjugal transfer protein n=1 Tax=Burkholderia cepacia TaxID=292 RepID=A0A2S8I7U4_BURCE|nr:MULTISPECIES: hypothetical protein [Burkholderia cepacia complex]PQP10853.1 hypothetical protein C5615_32855 [Burkholderia cepacia]TDA45956.1 hypothetical protein EVG18_18935 [Burkholderia pyrrocinia]HDR9511082.1 hypothetical protein [Burkholderia cepacia]